MERFKLTVAVSSSTENGKSGAFLLEGELRTPLRLSGSFLSKTSSSSSLASNSPDWIKGDVSFESAIVD